MVIVLSGVYKAWVACNIACAGAKGCSSSAIVNVIKVTIKITSIILPEYAVEDVRVAIVVWVVPTDSGAIIANCVVANNGLAFGYLI